MHDAVKDWVAEHIKPATSVVEFGSLDINGGVRHLLDDQALYVGIDVQSGPGVTIIADAATWTPDTAPIWLSVLRYSSTPRTGNRSSPTPTGYSHRAASL